MLLSKKSFINYSLLILSLGFLFFSCKSLPAPYQPFLSRKIMDKGLLNEDQLASYFIKHNPDADYNQIKDLARLYIEEAEAEGINSDVAFAQMCLETGYLKFGNLVQPEWHNYCGLGAMDAEHPGERFESEELGVRAHIQHLQAYGTTEDVKLNNELVDPRYNWVHKTKFITDINGLTNTWAMDSGYADKIERKLRDMEMERP